MLGSELFIGYVDYLRQLRYNLLLNHYSKTEFNQRKISKGDEYETIQLQTYVRQLYCG